MRDPQLTLFARAGKRARDAGMEEVEDHSALWAEFAIGELRKFAKENPKFTAPEFVLYLRLGPNHPNAWGPFWRRAKKERIVEESREPFVNSCVIASHARRVPVYRSLVQP